MPSLNGVPLSCEEILDRYGPLVYRMAIQGTGSVADGEDVAQEVFVSLIQSDPSFTDDTHLRAWLIRATANRCKSWGRSFWRKRTVPLELNQAAAPPPPENLDVLEAVAALPAKYRWPVYLHYIEGYTTTEIGQLLGCPRNTVLSRLSRAREKLKAALKEEWT
ncbi:RNA polymerase sigma factor [Pseudoflavonifractor phocaeensis]|uniref:RNA polymerase sigma factor n=1 Tax=Pseudoflavonifractor phocaeensis TaxID=1870988 RepID=UPI001956B9CD|nr:RNA polymerase sigma factor [Pseudoflavonifractor phocaeensis]MBM6721697.1 RNA polymerase sigma factor [Pseudoflavonifractor phocaeensis]